MVAPTVQLRVLCFVAYKQVVEVNIMANALRQYKTVLQGEMLTVNSLCKAKINHNGVVI